MLTPIKHWIGFLIILNPLISIIIQINIPVSKAFRMIFFDFQVEVVSQFSDEKNTFAIPFDTTTMILFYRKDVFWKLWPTIFGRNGIWLDTGQSGVYMGAIYWSIKMDWWKCKRMKLSSMEVVIWLKNIIRFLWFFQCSISLWWQVFWRRWHNKNRIKFISKYSC